MKINLKHKHHKKVILVQIIVLTLFFGFVYYFYPRVDLDFNGSFVRFNSINSNVIILADNEDFSDPRYVDFNEINNFSVLLKPGRYYYKSYNGILEGFTNEFVIDSEVGLIIDENNQDSELVNVGNVKLNVTKNKDGKMIGKITLEPNDKENIENRGEKYVGEEI